MTYYTSNKSEKIKQLKKLFKLELDNNNSWNEELFDYLLIKKTDTSKYLCGNIYHILSNIGRFVGDLYEFKCDRNDLIEYVLECYDILIGDIVIDNINVIDIKKHYYQMKKDNTIKKCINVNNIEIEIDLNKMKKIDYIDKFITYITRKLKLHIYYIGWNDTIYCIKTKEHIEMKHFKSCLYKRKQYKVLDCLV